MWARAARSGGLSLIRHTRTVTKALVRLPRQHRTLPGTFFYSSSTAHHARNEFQRKLKESKATIGVSRLPSVSGAYPITASRPGLRSMERSGSRPNHPPNHVPEPSPSPESSSPPKYLSGVIFNQLVRLFILGTSVTMVGKSIPDYEFYVYQTDFGMSVPISLRLLGQIGGRTLRGLDTLIECWKIYRPLKKGIESGRLVEGTPEYERVKSEAHTRASLTLLHLMMTNGGVYIKVGQSLAALDHIIPAEYTKSLSVLHSHVEPRPLQVMWDTLLNELPHDQIERISGIEEDPIGTASLAQVHKAWLDDGSVVAIKIQYPELWSLAFSDLLFIVLATRIVAKLNPHADWRWFAEEMENAMPQELNFLSEASNRETCARNLKNRSDVILPKIDYSMSTSKVLTMEFIQGVQADDPAALRKLGVSPVKVRNLVGSVFNDMIFKHGFVHCDPHAGNLAVRIKPGTGATPQLVLYDHGLYKVITDETRRDYSALWVALISGDEPSLVRLSEKFCRGRVQTDLFLSFVTGRPWSSTKSKLSGELTNEDVGNIQSVAMSDIGYVLSNISSELRLLFKTNDLVRHIDRALGATTQLTFAHQVYSAASSSVHEGRLENAGLVRRLYVRFLMMLDRRGLLLYLGARLETLWSRLLGLLGMSP